MNLSRQKIDIGDKIDQINAKIKQLQQSVTILKKGIESTEAGTDMIKGQSLLASEVRKIMGDNWI